MAIAYPPVNLSESVISAGAPNTLQKTVAFVSFGATNLTVGTRKLVRQYADISGNLPNGSWLIAAFTTFFAQGSAAAYVIELGTIGSNVNSTATATLGTMTQYQVSALAVAAGGSGWTVGETFSFPGGTGTVATISSGAAATVTLGTHPGQSTNPAGTAIAATATSGSGVGLTLNISSTNSQVSNGQVASIAVNVAGAGYSASPTVTITGGGGSGATAQATVASGGVSSITVLTPGTGYTSAPTVTVSPPPANLATQLLDYIIAAPLQNYLYVIDATSSQDAGIQTLVGNYDSYSSYTYFLLTLNASQAATFGLHKAGILFTPSLDAPSTEFGASAIAFMFASLTPSLAAKIMPFNYRFVTGLTVYAPPSSPLLTPLLQTNTNLVIAATAGGLPNNMLLGGETSDGNAINLWYGPDYASLNVTQALNNEIIEGSNNSANPLVYDQQGISRLLARAIQALNTARSVGAVIGPITVDAVDFVTYVTLNPSDFQQGVYNGLSFTVVPERGFNQITYAMTVDFTAASVAATAQ